MEIITFKEITTSMKTIYINEASFRLLDLNSKRVSFLEFFTNLKKFIVELLTRPTKARPSSRLAQMGYDRESLIQELLDRDIITRKEKFDEVYNQDTRRKESVYRVSFKVPRVGFKDKVREMYNDIDGGEPINEEGGIGGGATSCSPAGGDSVGQYTTPAFTDVMSRNVYDPKPSNKKKKTDVNGVDVSSATKRHDGKYGSISVPKKNS